MYYHLERHGKYQVLHVYNQCDATSQLTINNVIIFGDGPIGTPANKQKIKVPEYIPPHEVNDYVLEQLTHLNIKHDDVLSLHHANNIVTCYYIA